MKAAFSEALLIAFFLFMSVFLVGLPVSVSSIYYGLATAGSFLGGSAIIIPALSYNGLLADRYTDENAA